MLETFAKRNVIVSAALFAVSFALCLTHLKQSNATTDGPRAHVESNALVADSAPSVERTPAVAPSTPAAVSSEPSLASREAAAALSQTVATSEEGESRGDAIRQLGNLPTPEAVEALIQALKSDVDVRNRLLAVQSLKKLAEFGDGDSTIRNVLRETMSDPDETVAAFAREAHEAIVKRVGESR